MRLPRRSWVVVSVRTGDVVARRWTRRGAESAAAHLTVVASVRFDEAKARLLGEPLTFRFFYCAKDVPRAATRERR